MKILLLKTDELSCRMAQPCIHRWLIASQNPSKTRASWCCGRVSHRHSCVCFAEKWLFTTGSDDFILREWLFCITMKLQWVTMMCTWFLKWWNDWFCNDFIPCNDEMMIFHYSKQVKLAPYTIISLTLGKIDDSCIKHDDFVFKMVSFCIKNDELWYLSRQAYQSCHRQGRPVRTASRCDFPSISPPVHSISPPFLLYVTLFTPCKILSRLVKTAGWSVKLRPMYRFLQIHKRGTFCCPLWSS